jgi:hypothetical protein
LCSSLLANVSNNDPIYGGYAVGGFAPIGQTFQAVDALIGLAGFEMYVINNNQSSPPAITLDLYAGIGTAGLLVASRTFAGPPNAFLMPPRFLTGDFTGATLIPGANYTLSVIDPTNYWGITHTLDVYTGGTAVLCGSATAACNFSPFAPSQIDFKFEVLAASPEPATVFLIFGACAVVIPMRMSLAKRNGQRNSSR